MKLKKVFISLMVLLLPITSFAYSQEVYIGGENIGIEVKTKGVLVVGEYYDTDLDKGDYIIKINNNDITSINDFSKEIEKDIDKESIDITYKRGKSINTTSIKIYKENDSYKTGLYVKDEVSGIGTLTLIDPSNNKFLALGHAVLDSSTNTILEIDNGSIYSSYITGVNRSSNGSPGEKIGEADTDNIYGTISSNTDKGIFGKFEYDLNNKELIKIGKPSEISLGKASLLTVLDGNEIGKYSINIDKIDKNDNLKNMLFTITDKTLLDKTGGIVQGMSGSPIIQNGKIIGAVTHVIVDDCTRGYGIFITNMLEESEKE